MGAARRRLLVISAPQGRPCGPLSRPAPQKPHARRPHAPRTHRVPREFGLELLRRELPERQASAAAEGRRRICSNINSAVRVRGDGEVPGHVVPSQMPALAPGLTPQQAQAVAHPDAPSRRTDVPCRPTRRPCDDAQNAPSRHRHPRCRALTPPHDPSRTPRVPPCPRRSSPGAIARHVSACLAASNELSTSPEAGSSATSWRDAPVA
jgi:hypothetical protein